MATQAPKTVAFVLYPGLTLLDLVGPLQVFTSLRQFNNQYRPVVVAERLEPMATDGPLTVTADHTFGDVPDPTVIIVPGGDAPTIKAMGDSAIREYLRQAADTAPVVGSVCTGGHWSWPRPVCWRDGRLPPTGPITGCWSVWAPPICRSGGWRTASSSPRPGCRPGPNMALALVARLTDEPTARMVQVAIEYDPHPPFGGIDWDQVDRDIYEPVLGPVVQQQLADRPELLAKLSG
jgi:hypothetical protein